jgi:hypothetical protein
MPTEKTAENPDEQSKPQPTGYQIYVRVPNGDHASQEDISSFLEDLAKLLSDERKDVTVLPFLENDDKITKIEPGRGAGGGAARPKAPYHAAGGPRSPLYPMIVCHNRN